MVVKLRGERSSPTIREVVKKEERLLVKGTSCPKKPACTVFKYRWLIQKKKKKNTLWEPELSKQLTY